MYFYKVNYSIIFINIIENELGNSLRYLTISIENKLENSLVIYFFNLLK